MKKKIKFFDNACDKNVHKNTTQASRLEIEPKINYFYLITNKKIIILLTHK